MSIEQLTSRVRESFGGCPQCSKRGYVPDCIFCGGVNVSLTSEQNEMIMAAANRKTNVLKKTKSPTLDVDTKVKNEFTDTPMRFSGLHGGVLSATPMIKSIANQSSRTAKNKVAVIVRIDCTDTCWHFYNQGVVFTLFSADEKTCRFECQGRYVIYPCRIIRDADDLPEAIAQAAADLWKAE